MPDATTAFRAGAWAWALTGAGYLTIAAVLALRPANPATAPAAAAMRNADFGFAGPRHSLCDLNTGMSLVMGVALVFAGLVCVLVARRAPGPIGRSLSGLQGGIAAGFDAARAIILSARPTACAMCRNRADRCGPVRGCDESEKLTLSAD